MDLKSFATRKEIISPILQVNHFTRRVSTSPGGWAITVEVKESSKSFEEIEAALDEDLPILITGMTKRVLNNLAVITALKDPKTQEDWKYLTDAVKTSKPLDHEFYMMMINEAKEAFLRHYRVYQDLDPFLTISLSPDIEEGELLGFAYRIQVDPNNEGWGSHEPMYHKVFFRAGFVTENTAS